MTDGNGATVGVHAGIIEGQLQQLQATQHLRRERLVDLDDIKVLQPYACPGHRLGDCQRRADTHHARRHAHRGAGQHARQGFDAQPLAQRPAAHQQRRRAIVDAGGVCGGDGAVGDEGRLQLRHRFEQVRQARAARRAHAQPQADTAAAVGERLLHVAGGGFGQGHGHGWRSFRR